MATIESSSQPIRIWGASDDLVEVDGLGIRQEFDAYGPWAGELTAPDGQMLTVCATFGAKGWELMVAANSDDGYPAWPIRFGERTDREGDPCLHIYGPEGTTIKEVK